jgi:hypothetical protein
VLKKVTAFRQNDRQKNHKKPECIETKQSSTSAVLNFLKSTTGRHLSLLQIRWAHQTLARHAVCINGLGPMVWQGYTSYPIIPAILITLWLFKIAMENGPVIDGLPIKNGDFPWLC